MPKGMPAGLKMRMGLTMKGQTGSLDPDYPGFPVVVRESTFDPAGIS